MPLTSHYSGVNCVCLLSSCLLGWWGSLAVPLSCFLWVGECFFQEPLGGVFLLEGIKLHHVSAGWVFPFSILLFFNL